MVMGRWRYPLFYADGDGWMTFISSDKELDKALEFNDVDGEAYECWDVEGIRVSLGWDGSGVVVVSKAGKDMGGLLAAIRKYAELERVSTRTEAGAGMAADPLALWKDIDTGLKARG